MSLADIKHINPASVLDIGANCADWYREAKAMWPDAKFWLIEGNPACRPALEATGEPFTIAYLGDSYKKAEFYKRKGGSTDTGNSLYRELTPFFADDQIDVETVQLYPLRLLKPARMEFSLIKCDVQGAELDVIRGGLETFKRASHILLEVSYEIYNEGAPLSDETFAFMHDLGFTKRQIIGDICHPIDRKRIVQKDVLFSK